MIHFGLTATSICGAVGFLGGWIGRSILAYGENKRQEKVIRELRDCRRAGKQEGKEDG